MGMFDTVVIEGLKLPPLPKNVKTYLKTNNAELSNEYQTKDLDNCLSTYTIDKNGSMFATVYKPTGKKEPYKDIAGFFKDNRSVLEKLYYKFKFKKLDRTRPKFVDVRKPVREKVYFTNTFNIYTYNEIAGRFLDVEFELTAEKGKIVKIKFVKSELESESAAKKRKANDIEFNQKLEKSFQARRKLTSSWYYPLLKEVYNPFVFFSRLTIQAICNKILIWTCRWHGV